MIEKVGNILGIKRLPAGWKWVSLEEVSACRATLGQSDNLQFHDVGVISHSFSVMCRFFRQVSVPWSHKAAVLGFQFDWQSGRHTSQS